MLTSDRKRCCWIYPVTITNIGLQFLASGLLFYMKSGAFHAFWCKAVVLFSAFHFSLLVFRTVSIRVTSGATPVFSNYAMQKKFCHFSKCCTMYMCILHILRSRHYTKASRWSSCISTHDATIRKTHLKVTLWDCCVVANDAWWPLGVV